MMLTPRIEDVRSKKFPGAYRVWIGEALDSATCTYCGEHVPAADLVGNRSAPGGLALCCRPCQAAKNARRDPNELRERSKNYRERYPEKTRAAALRWRAENPEKARENDRRQYRRRLLDGRAAEAHRRRRQALRSRTPEQIAEDRERLRPDGLKRCRSCGESLPLERFPTVRRERDGLGATCKPCDAERKRDRLGRLTETLHGEDRSTWKCYVCGGPYEEIEHLWPVSLFGEDRPSNLLPACVSCNRGRDGKHDRDPREWLLDRLGAEAAWEILAERLPASLLLTA